MRNLLNKLWFVLLSVMLLFGVVVTAYSAGPSWFKALLGLNVEDQIEETVPKAPSQTFTTSADIPSTNLPETVQGDTYITKSYLTTNPVTQVNQVLSLANTATDRLLYVDGNTQLSALSSGNSGQVLSSRGEGSSPEWVSLGTLSADWGSPGEIGASTPNTAVFTKATLTGNSVPLSVGSGSQFQVLNTGRLELSYVGDSGYLSSSGGAIFIDNTDNIGTGLGIFSNAAGDAQGNMINVKVDNPLYNQAAFYMNYDGLSNAVEIVSNSSDTSSNALAVTGNNINDSTLGIIGYELAKGTIKISHYRPGTGNDTSASAISIDLKGVGTRAQGVYVDSTETGGTLGNLLRLRNESVDKFVVDYQGSLTMKGSVTQGANGSNTTFTKYGNVSGDEFFIGSNAALRFQRSASNSETFRTQIAGDANGRWVGTSDGRLRWGNGTDATDVTILRLGVGRLSLEGGMVFNNLNADYDSVFKGVSDSNLLYIDAGANEIGIGDSSPSFKLDVAGTGRFTGALQVDSNLAVGATSFGTDAANVLAIANSTAPSTSITNGIQLFAVDQTGSHELRVRDEAGNVTTLSPHNFSILPDGLSEPYAWSYYSERNGLAVSADMTRALRLVENLSGEQLLYFKDLNTNQYLNVTGFSQVVDSEPDTQTLTDQLQQYVSLELLQTFVDWSSGSWTFLKSVVFKAEATFQAGVVFLKDVHFFGRLEVSSDTAGQVSIPAGATAITVEFEQPYSKTPLVYLTPLSEKTEGYGLVEVSRTGFTINLAQPLDQEVKFNWLAVLGSSTTNKTSAHFDQQTTNVEPKSELDETILPTTQPFVEPLVAGEATDSANLEEIIPQTLEAMATSSAGQKSLE